MLLAPFGFKHVEPPKFMIHVLDSIILLQLYADTAVISKFHSVFQAIDFLVDVDVPYGFHSNITLATDKEVGHRARTNPSIDAID